MRLTAIAFSLLDTVAIIARNLITNHIAGSRRDFSPIFPELLDIAAAATYNALC
jgi:hypothetical protein